MKKWIRYFSPGEWALWLLSMTAVVLSFVIFDRSAEGLLTLAASLLGVTSLIFAAKGNPLGQVLIILFSLLYGVISYTFRYWGEMVTYLGMTMPMAVVALIAWLRHPYKGNRAEVAVHSMTRREIVVMLLLTVLVTAGFGFILWRLDTPNLVFSILSVTTSFLAVFMTARRSPFFALAYASNDAVLILLWVLASLRDVSYLSVVICFCAFLVNDLYGFISWRRMEKKQKERP